LVALHLSLTHLQFNGIWEILGVLGTVGDYSPKRVAYCYALFMEVLHSSKCEEGSKAIKMLNFCKAWLGTLSGCKYHLNNALKKAKAKRHIDFTVI